VCMYLCVCVCVCVRVSVRVFDGGEGEGVVRGKRIDSVRVSALAALHIRIESYTSEYRVDTY